MRNSVLLFILISCFNGFSCGPAAEERPQEIKLEIGKANQIQTLTAKDTTLTGRITKIDSIKRELLFKTTSEERWVGFAEITAVATQPLPDFKITMLLLSAALGLSLTIERILEFVKGIIRKMLLKEDSPFAKKTPSPEEVIAELGYDKINAVLDDKVEKIEELNLKITKASGAEATQLKAEVAKIEAEGVDLIKKYRGIVSTLGASRYLPKKEKSNLEKKQANLQTWLNDKNGLKTEWAEYDEEFSEATVFIDPIGPRDEEKTARVFWLQIIGTLSGVVICYFSKFGIFDYLLQEAQISGAADWILTGVLIGGGSQPIHTLIKFLTERKVTDMQVSLEKDLKSAEEEVQKEAPPIIIKPTISYEMDVPYRGGVDRDRLENRHLRTKGNPNLIVYHHTAMHSDTTFADVVKVIKDKQWITGYHCVILKDGSIHPFCRWDRFGNHAKGNNLKSLGIAMNGNFEPNPKVSFSNVNGTLGILRPTDEQLLSASKVVALWCHLYKIPLDFAKSILPHKALSPKACPGSNFPYDKFKTLVDQIYNHWQTSPEANEKLELFSQKQYLYV